MLAHFLFHIAPGGKNALAPYAIHLIHDTVKDPHTHIGHTNLISIRETEGHTHAHVIFILFNFVKFSAGIPCRLLHSRENPL